MRKKIFLIIVFFQFFSLWANTFSDIYKTFADTQFSEQGRVLFVTQYNEYLQQKDTIFLFQDSEEIRQLGYIIQKQSSSAMTQSDIQSFQINCFQFQELSNGSSKAGEKLLTATIFGFFVLMSLLLIALRYIIYREEKYRKERFQNQIERSVEEAEIRTQSLERQHLYRTLHDTISQNIKAELLFTEHLEEYLDSNEEAIKNITTIRKLQENSLNEIRGILTLYKPVSMKEGPFDLLVKDFCASFMEATKLKISLLLDNEKAFNSLSEEQKDCIYNVIKEALNNSFRHAKAESASVIFRKDEKTEQNILLICDDGCGFDINKVDKEKHHGLSIMKSRAMLINAELTVRSNFETGTEIILKL